MAQEKIFAEGIYFDKKEKAPSYVVGSLSFKVGPAVEFLQKYVKQTGYVNVDIKLSANGKYYCELNTWVPDKSNVQEEESNQEKLNNMDKEDKVEYPKDDINPDDIPF